MPVVGPDCRHDGAIPRDYDRDPDDALWHFKPLGAGARSFAHAEVVGDPAVALAHDRAPGHHDLDMLVGDGPLGAPTSGMFTPVRHGDLLMTVNQAGTMPGSDLAFHR